MGWLFTSVNTLWMWLALLESSILMCECMLAMWALVASPVDPLCSLAALRALLPSVLVCLSGAWHASVRLRVEARRSQIVACGMGTSEAGYLRCRLTALRYQHDGVAV